MSDLVQMRMKPKTAQRLKALSNIYSLNRTQILTLAVDQLFLQHYKEGLTDQDKTDILEARAEKAKGNFTTVNSEQELINYLDKLDQEALQAG